jgi:hypothetical protein
VQADRRLVVGLLPVVAQRGHAQELLDLPGQLRAQRLGELHARHHADHGDAAPAGPPHDHHPRLVLGLGLPDLQRDLVDLVDAPVEQVLEGDRVEDRGGLGEGVAAGRILEPRHHLLDALADHRDAPVGLLERLGRHQPDEHVLAERRPGGAALRHAEVAHLGHRPHDGHEVGAVVGVQLLAGPAGGDDLADTSSTAPLGPANRPSPRWA